MSVVDQLASALNRKDEAANIELAKRISEKNDELAVSELIANLQNKNKAVQSDCIKVLYETGLLKRKLISTYTPKVCFN